jgi:hypothetical protein
MEEEAEEENGVTLGEKLISYVEKGYRIVCRGDDWLSSCFLLPSFPTVSGHLGAIRYLETVLYAARQPSEMMAAAPRH